MLTITQIWVILLKTVVLILNGTRIRTVPKMVPREIYNLYCGKEVESYGLFLSEKQQAARSLSENVVCGRDPRYCQNRYERQRPYRVPYLCKH